MKKLLKKSGFTTVEMIVVLAIMAIMLAIVIPIISVGDSRKTEAREYARAFYSNVQELMMDEKLAKNPLPGGDTTNYVLVCAEVDGNGTSYSDVLIYMTYSADFSFTNPVLLQDSDPNDAENKLTLPPKEEFTEYDTYHPYEEFATSLRRLQFGNDKSGYCFAVVDHKYRVVCAYFVNALNDDTDFASVFSAINGKQFTDEAIIDNRIVGAYPEALDAKGKNFPSKP